MLLRLEWRYPSLIYSCPRRSAALVYEIAVKHEIEQGIVRMPLLGWHSNHYTAPSHDPNARWVGKEAAYTPRAASDSNCAPKERYVEVVRHGKMLCPDSRA